MTGAQWFAIAVVTCFMTFNVMYTVDRRREMNRRRRNNL